MRTVRSWLEGSMITRILGLFITFACFLSSGIDGTAKHIEERRMNFDAEILKTVLSKIAPVEQWNASWPESGPKVCWELFRPTPEKHNGLLSIVLSFRGKTQWRFLD